MPFEIRKMPNRNCYRVTNVKTGQIHAKCTSRKNAEAQIRLLYAVDNGYQLRNKNKFGTTAGGGDEEKAHKSSMKTGTKPPRRISFHETTDSQKECRHGKVQFNGRTVPAIEYIENVSTRGSLGCAGMFPKFKNGKYCCSSRESSNSSKLKYAKSILENAMNNVDYTNFHKVRVIINRINEFRNQLFTIEPRLLSEDERQFTTEYNAWLSDMTVGSNATRSDLEDRRR